MAIFVKFRSLAVELVLEANLVLAPVRVRVFGFSEFFSEGKNDFFFFGVLNVERRALLY